MEQLQLPARIGKYELVEFLGGGMSHVYRARDTLIGGTVVVKILSEAANRDPDARARFLREARMARNVTHENIVAIYDFGEEQGRPFMVMEHLKGEDLLSAISEGRTGDLPQRLRIAIQIARAMECIHAQGIVHRDVKPHNVHLNPDGKVKLMDFGIAKTEDHSITRVGYTLGTPYYMAPEQVMGQKVTSLADVYAFGILLFELTTSVKPIQADTVERIFYEILRKPLDLSPMRMLGIPQPICELVSRCTAKAPAERIQSFTAVREELQRILQELEFPSRPSRWQGLARGLVRALRGRALAVAAVLIVVAVVVVALVVHRPPAPPPKKEQEPARTIVTSTGRMVLVPAGEFLLGTDKRKASLPAFYIDETEISYRAYAEFCRAKGRSLPPGYSEARLNYPVADITIADAEEFAAWADKRLPTAAEWEKAARGTDGRLYPWGDQPEAERANVSDNGSLMVHAVMPVDSFRNGASPCGALNLTGNVAEFVKEPFQPSADVLKRLAKTLKPQPTADEPWFTTRGGAWTSKLAASAPHAISPVPARWRDPTTGFRCAKD